MTISSPSTDLEDPDIPGSEVVVSELDGAVGLTLFSHSHSTSHPLHARTVLRSIYGDQAVSHWHPSSSVEKSGSQSSDTVRYQVSLK